jgi:hypothetical protein
MIQILQHTRPSTIHSSPTNPTSPQNSPSPTPRSPNFAAFDHGDHYHFIFTTAHTNNTSRSLNHILQFFKASFAGVAEANTTLQYIRFPDRFISYLIRKGIRTFTKYGNKSIPILRHILAHLKTITDIDSATFEPCDTYTEEKKAQKKETITQRTFSIDYINSLIQTHNIESYEDFQRRLQQISKYNYSNN